MCRNLIDQIPTHRAFFFGAAFVFVFFFAGSSETQDEPEVTLLAAEPVARAGSSECASATGTLAVRTATRLFFHACHHMGT